MLYNIVNKFKTQLKDNGYKLTTQRIAVLDVIIKNRGKHLSTEEIYNHVKSKHPNIGIATIYRTLILFNKLNLLHKLNLDDNYNRYELKKSNEDHRHHHIICTKCGKVAEVKGDLLEALEEEILIKNGFLVKDHRVKFYGYCKDCR